MSCSADTSCDVAHEQPAEREGMAAATPQRPLAAEPPAAAGFVDKVERMSRSFVVERKRSRSAGKAPARGWPKGPSEEEIHRSVVAWLDRRATKGVHFFHVPNGEVRHKGAAGKLKGMGAKAGEPDIVLIYRGHTYGLELKAAGGVQSAEQEHVERQWEQAGATYAVARGVDYALDTLREWGLLQ